MKEKSRDVTLVELHQKTGEICREASFGVVTIYVTDHGRRVAKITQCPDWSSPHNPRPRNPSIGDPE